MIGLALVTLVATLAAGITSTFRGSVDKIFVSDYAITAQNNFSPIPTEAARCGREGRRASRRSPARGRVRRGSSTRPSSSRPSTPDAGEVLSLDVEGGLAGRLLRAGRERRLRRRRLRRGPRPAHRLADHDPGPVREAAPARGEGDLRSSGRRLAVRRASRSRARPSTASTTRRGTSTASSRCAGTSPTRTRRRSRTSLERLPEREGADARRVRRQPDQRPQPDAEHPLRAARAVGDRQPLRDRRTRSCSRCSSARASSGCCARSG